MIGVEKHYSHKYFTKMEFKIISPIIDSHKLAEFCGSKKRSKICNNSRDCSVTSLFCLILLIAAMAACFMTAGFDSVLHKIAGCANLYGACQLLARVAFGRVDRAPPIRLEIHGGRAHSLLGMMAHVGQFRRQFGNATVFGGRGGGDGAETVVGVAPAARRLVALDADKR
jgi:hypothetical protein